MKMQSLVMTVQNNVDVLKAKAKPQKIASESSL